MSNLVGKALNAEQNMVSVAAHLSDLIAAINNAIPTLTSDGATDSLAKVQALQSAISPVSQAVIDAAATYTEADALNT